MKIIISFVFVIEYASISMKYDDIAHQMDTKLFNIITNSNSRGIALDLLLITAVMTIFAACHTNFINCFVLCR